MFARSIFAAALIASLPGAAAAFACKSVPSSDAWKDIEYVETNPQFSYRPTPQEARNFYPPLAEQARVPAGRAALSCQSSEGPRLVNCQVTSEEPKGYGFGESALQLAEYYDHCPLYKEGRYARSAVRFTIRFDAGDATATEAAASSSPSRRARPSSQQNSAAAAQNLARGLASGMQRVGRGAGTAVRVP
jgi:hypothetical protein